MTHWDRLTVRAGWAILVAFAALSSYLNARAAQLASGATTEAIVFHAAVPVVLLVAGLFAELVALSGVHRVAKFVTVSGLVAVFAVTLIASYLAILDVVARWNPYAPGWVNAGISAVPDIVMVMAGTVVLSLRVRRHGLAPAASRTPAPSRWRRLADAAAARAEAALAVPEKQQLEGFVEGSVEARGGSGKPVVDPIVEGRGVSADPSADLSTEARGESSEPVVDPSADSLAEGSQTSADPELAPFLEIAQRLAEARVVRGKTATDYARILAADARGWSPTKIKAEFGFSHATTAKVVAAVAGAQSPALTVV